MDLGGKGYDDPEGTGKHVQHEAELVLVAYQVVGN
jgi:hypothetical protein